MASSDASPRSGGFAPRLLEFADELRGEGMHVGTSELLDAFAALEHVPWTNEEDFRAALAATLAKSQEDRRVFDILFERYFFRAVERQAVERGLTEQQLGDDGGYQGDQNMIDLDSLRNQIRNAVREGSDGQMRDLARLAIAAFGREGTGSGVIGVDVQRIRRTLGLRGQSEHDMASRPDPDAVPRERLRRFERHLRRELERDQIERTEALPPARPLREFDRALPTNPLQDLAAVHRVVMQLKRRLATQGHEMRGRRRGRIVDVRRTMRASLETGGVPLHLRGVDERHRRKRLLPVGLACAARLVPEAALVRLRRADLRGERGVRARAVVQGGLARDRDRLRRRRRVGLHRLRARLARVLRA